MEGLLVGRLAGEAGALGQVRLDADDGLDAAGAGLLVEGDDAVERAVVGERRWPPAPAPAPVP